MRIGKEYAKKLLKHLLINNIDWCHTEFGIFTIFKSHTILGYKAENIIAKHKS